MTEFVRPAVAFLKFDRGGPLEREISGFRPTPSGSRKSAICVIRCRPLLPGALAEDIERTSEAAHDELRIELPTEIREILAEVDGFSENGVSLYGSDQNFPDEAMYGPTIVAENLSLWATMPQAAEKYLFVGDSDHGYFAFELERKQYVALARSTLEPIHCYASATEMVNDMLREALQIGQQDDLSAVSTANLEAELTRRRLGW